MSANIAQWVVDSIVAEGDLNAMCQVIVLTNGGVSFDSCLVDDLRQCVGQHVYDTVTEAFDLREPHGSAEDLDAYDYLDRLIYEDDDGMLSYVDRAPEYLGFSRDDSSVDSMCELCAQALVESEYGYCINCYLRDLVAEIALQEAEMGRRADYEQELLSVIEIDELDEDRNDSEFVDLGPDVIERRHLTD